LVYTGKFFQKASHETKETCIDPPCDEASNIR
jgi:hypothetical protein